MGVTRFGAYATEVIVDYRYLYPIPSSWTFEGAASFLCQALTAWYGLVELGGLRPSSSEKEVQKNVLIHSVAGGVGLCALQIASFCSAAVVGTVGSSQKVEFLIQNTSLPAEKIIVRTSPKEFASQLHNALRAPTLNDDVCEAEKIDADGYDIIMDSLCSAYFKPAFDCLARGGRHIVFGAADFMASCGDKPNWFTLAWKYLKRPTIDPMEMISANKSVMGFNLIWLWDKVDEMTRILEEMMACPWKEPHVGQTFLFSEALAAQKFMQTGESIGKIVLIVKKR